MENLNDRTIDVTLSISELYIIKEGLVSWMEQVNDDNPIEQVNNVKSLGRKVMNILDEQFKINKEIRKK